MTKDQWGEVLARDYDNPVPIVHEQFREESIDPGDVVQIIYRYTQYRYNTYIKRFQTHRGKISIINESGVEFECGKRLSYRSIYDISTPVKDHASTWNG